MTDSIQALVAHVEQALGSRVTNAIQRKGELTLEVKPENLREVCQTLRDDQVFAFDQLIDVCGVDYLTYGAESEQPLPSRPRFAVAYHLLSVRRNHRVRLRVYPEGEPPMLPSVIDVWQSANWYEREAFDLFGIIFEGHPDLRRILTDYGFIGHPFRKDFPLIGEVEMRYDPEKGRVVYEPVSIEPRVLVPRVIREEGYGGRDT